MNLKELMTEALEAKGAAKEKPSPIPCLGRRDYWGEYDCDYEHAGAFGCEDCVVNGGRYDPRTGHAYRAKKPKKPKG